MSWPFSNVTPCGRRDRPVPIPSPGIQLVNLSHVEDLAEMMAAVPGNAAAVRQHFNLASDRAITFDGMLLSRYFPSFSLLWRSSFPGNAAAVRQRFNLASDRAITYGGTPPLFLSSISSCRDSLSCLYRFASTMRQRFNLPPTLHHL